MFHVAKVKILDTGKIYTIIVMSEQSIDSELSTCCSFMFTGFGRNMERIVTREFPNCTNV